VNAPETAEKTEFPTRATNPTIPLKMSDTRAKNPEKTELTRSTKLVAAVVNNVIIDPIGNLEVWKEVSANMSFLYF